MPHALSNDTETITFINALLLYGVHTFYVYLTRSVQFPPDRFTLTLNKIANTSIQIWNSISFIICTLALRSHACGAYSKGFLIQYRIQNYKIPFEWMPRAILTSLTKHSALQLTAMHFSQCKIRLSAVLKEFSSHKIQLTVLHFSWWLSYEVLVQVSRHESHRMHHLKIYYF